jgi:NAD(P)-dependent dehydrogenase (short-subunit alcohol dehydrogenase family)
MPARLKPLDQQVIVVTGGTSGIGLATARRAAAGGARVMIAARDEEALREVCDSIVVAGGVADFVVCDVGVENDVEQLAATTIERFGGFDSWVNNAGVGIYGEAIEVSTDDHRRLFDTNYWGTVYGTLAAVRHLKTRPGGGAIINLGSINSDMGGPLLSAYNASKHAIKGFTDSVRLELIAADAPISLTLVKPSPVGTPFPQHGRNVTGFKARLPRPMYAPEVVAEAIVAAVQHEHRAVTVGGTGKLQVLGANLFPQLFDQLASRMGPALTDRSQPQPAIEGNLFAPQGKDGQTDGDQKGRRISGFTAASLNPIASVGIVTAATLVGVALVAGDRIRTAVAKRLS